MEILATGEIHSIAIGHPKEGFTYTVGRTHKVNGDELEIIQILRDDAAFHFHGTIRYVIYVQNVRTNEEFCWKYFENQIIAVTCKS
jgi:hypothetical protein